MDGVGEMAASSNLLSTINKQLKGWVAEARIVLACRLNVWDARKNDLYTFEKYRIQQLSYADRTPKPARREALASAFFASPPTDTNNRAIATAILFNTLQNGLNLKD